MIGAGVIAALSWVWNPLFVLSVTIGSVGVLALWEWIFVSKGALRLGGIPFLVGGFLSLEYVLFVTGWQGLSYIVGIAIMTDTSAYIGGRLIRGPKLCPAISPQKTWAGAIMSLMITPGVGAWLGKYVGPQFSFETRWILAIVLCLAAQGGDLMESAAKRRLGIKDTGTLLPGHGGVLDRIDSWLMVGIVSTILLEFLHFY
jgi:phosphatidate cytidylyltransferase